MWLNDCMTTDCSTCRHHTKQKRIYPGFSDGERNRDLDEKKDTFLCLGEGPYKGRDLVEPVHCEGYSPGQVSQIPSDLDRRMEAALARMQRRRE